MIAVGRAGPAGGSGRMRAVKVLLVSPDPQSLETMRLAVGGIERRAELAGEAGERADAAAHQVHRAEAPLAIISVRV